MRLEQAISNELQKFGEAKLLFVCTHNSRRSQFAQAWAHVLADQWNLPIQSASAGTEVTACNERTVAALERSGFKSRVEKEGSNPHYEMQYGEGTTFELYSKIYTDAFQPEERIIAVMTCAHAEANCPMIPGAVHRIPMPYEDPKAKDDTPEETSAYDATCAQIRNDLHAVFSRINITK